MINLSRKTVALSAAGCFFVYLILTLVQMLPEWQGFTAIESLAIAKHLVMVAVIIAMLILKPQLGSWIAVVWGAIVPFERYSLLVSELLNGSIFNFGALAPLDTLRLLLLLAGTCVSALLAYQLYLTKSEAAANANA
jgi:hypothetical protein